MDAPSDFYARALAAADPEGRLPVPEGAGWEIFPFEMEGLVCKPLEPPVLPEPERGGEAPGDCRRCADPERGVVWSDDRWILVGLEPCGLPFGALLLPRAHLDLGDLDDTHAADLGRLIVAVDRAARALGGVGRVHVNKWGDGGAHLHVFFLARPEGLLQLRGSNLALWEEMLPRLPKEVTAGALQQVATTLAAQGGRAHV